MPSAKYIEAIDLMVVKYMGKLGFPMVHRTTPHVVYSDHSEYQSWDNVILLQENPPSGELLHLAHELVHSHQVIHQNEVSMYYLEDGSIDYEIWQKSWFEQQAEAVAKLVWLQTNGYFKEVTRIICWSTSNIGAWCHAPIEKVIEWANV